MSANDISANEEINDESVGSQQTDVFIVEKIVDQRMKRKIKQYFVKWKDYPESENTWEPAKNIYDKSVIEIFEKEQSTNNDESSTGSEVIKKRSSKRNASTLEKQPRQKISKSSKPVVEIQTDGNSMSPPKSNITAEGSIVSQDGKFSTAQETSDTPVSALTTKSTKTINGLRHKINNVGKKVDRKSKNFSDNSNDTITVSVTINGITVPFFCQKSQFNF